MRRRPIALACMLALAGTLSTAGLAAKVVKAGPLTFSVSLIQEATYRHVHPPGHANDTFSTMLKLNAIGTVLGFPNGTRMGTMAFNWGPLNGSCSSSSAFCSGTTNIQTVTTLPGGTITAGSQHVSVGNGITVPVEGGTGIFKGVKGTVYVAPGGDHVDIFKLQMP